MTKLGSLFALAALASAIALAPSAAFAAEAAKTVVCKDGATAEGGRGACRGHGGVDKAATAKAQGGAAAAAGEEKAAKAEEKADRKAKKAEEKAAEGAGTVICKDGATSKGGRGACRGHGGVDKTATAKSAAPSAPAAAPGMPAPPAAAPPAAPSMPSAPSARAPAAPAAPVGAMEQPDPAKGPPTARCKDGSLSYAKHHTGACSRHGGVGEWLDKK
ncbi:MAG TPA: DUF3761 domain-containing protein [Anaeromyxobacteraceae bacterium]|jgi:hypothetical protein|nr:DUF3761 domain-containing protein [Anaeromyxobacteraceae bacterium]